MWLHDHPAIGDSQICDSVRFKDSLDFRKMIFLLKPLPDMLDDVIANDYIVSFIRKG